MDDGGKKMDYEGKYYFQNKFFTILFLETCSQSMNIDENDNSIHISKIRGFLNKITESNFHNIINQIIELIEKNSKQMLAEILCFEIIKVSADNSFK